MRSQRIPGIVGSVLFCVSGCAIPADDAPRQGATPFQDDVCLARVRFEGTAYRPGPRSHDNARPQGRALGHGALIDCSGKKIGDGVVSRYRVKVFALPGVSPAEAIVIGAGDARGTFVDEQLPHSAWAAPVRRP